MIEINNLTKIRISRKGIENFVKKLFQKLKIKKDLSLVLVNNKRIKKLNQIYLKKNRSTDVLSFAGENNFLGEIVVSLEQAKKQAKEQGHAFKKELKILITHGLLHLLGFGHRKEKDRRKMELREKELINL